MADFHPFCFCRWSTFCSFTLYHNNCIFRFKENIGFSFPLKDMPVYSISPVSQEIQAFNNSFMLASDPLFSNKLLVRRIAKLPRKRFPWIANQPRQQRQRWIKRYFLLAPPRSYKCPQFLLVNARVTSAVTLYPLRRKASGSHGSSKKIRFDDYMNQLHK